MYFPCCSVESEHGRWRFLAQAAPVTLGAGVSALALPAALRPPRLRGAVRLQRAAGAKSVDATAGSRRDNVKGCRPFARQGDGRSGKCQTSSRAQNCSRLELKSRDRQHNPGTKTDTESVTPVHLGRHWPENADWKRNPTPNAFCEANRGSRMMGPLKFPQMGRRLSYECHVLTVF